MNNPTLILLATVATTILVGLPYPAQTPSFHEVRQGRSIAYCSPFSGSSPSEIIMSSKSSSYEFSILLF